MGYPFANEMVHSARYHIIWCPRYRRQVLVGRVEARSQQNRPRLVENQKRAA